MVIRSQPSYGNPPRLPDVPSDRFRGAANTDPDGKSTTRRAVFVFRALYVIMSPQSAYPNNSATNSCSETKARSLGSDNSECLLIYLASF
jgi:hypothetical protein